MWPFKKKITPLTNEIKEFEFSSLEVQCVGDQYDYIIKATTREEAFKKLVQYFFDEENSSEDIKSYSSQVHFPSSDRFLYKGMPRWFAKRISGVRRDHDYNYQHSLEEYCFKNNINLKKH